MIITRKHLSRRTVLKGLGTAISLPLLDAMTPALAAPAKSPVRMAIVYVPNGIILEDFRPKSTGRDWEMTRILKPLESLRNDFSILTGLDDHNGNALGDGPGDHGRAGASFLTGVHCVKTAGADIRAGISADQIAAQAIGSKTRVPSLELGCEDSRTVGNCDSGYSCAYTNNLSWRNPTTPLPPELNPRLTFERMFGNIDTSVSPAVRARREQYRKSILDMVREDTQKLTGTLGATDRRKVDEYLYAIREIEQRIARAEKDNRNITPAIEKPAGIPMTFKEYSQLTFDLLHIAFQADLTRVCTLMLAREGSMRVYPEIGIPDPHHPLTHHRNQQDWIEKVKQINVFHTTMLAYFLNKLKTTREGDGNLLNNSMIVYGCALADGNRHEHENLPILLAGRGGGAFQPGRHIVYKKGTPFTNLLMSMLDRLDVHPEKIGDSTGKLDQLSDLA
ncbi:MAG: DUF1552 domain-containing protein [Blastocatellia bacterium]